VSPRYAGTYDIRQICDTHGVRTLSNTLFLNLFGITKPGLFAFIISNISGAVLLIKHIYHTSVSFIYIRSSFFMPLACIAYVFRIPCFYESHRVPIGLSERIRDFGMSIFSYAFIVISEHLRRYYARYNKPILVVHDGVSLARFTDTYTKEQAREKLSLQDKNKVCVYTGTLSTLKGVDYIFATAQHMPDVSFVLAGSLSQEFKDMALPSNILLLGALPQKEIVIVLAAADVLLLPHPRGEYSQSPMKLFEYMASNRPIVASKLPSIMEVLHETNALLIEPEDVSALRAGITFVFNNQEESNRRAEEGKRTVVKYTWEKRGASIADFIHGYSA